MQNLQTRDWLSQKLGMLSRARFNFWLADRAIRMNHRHAMDVNDPAIFGIEENADLARIIA